MKYNTTYTPGQSLKETVQSVAGINAKLIKAVLSKYKFTKVTPPMYYEENSPIAVDMNKITRSVSFDFGDEYKVATLALTHTNWLRNMIRRMELSAGEGLFIESSYIWRDIPENPASSSVRDEVTFQFKTTEEGSIELVKDLAEDIYEEIFKLFNDVKTKYGIKNVYPEFAEYISAQQLDNEMPSETFRQREVDMVMEKNAYILEAPGYKLFSGKTHTYIPPALYDLKHHYQVVLKDTVNSGVLKVASVAITSSGQQLSDQLSMYNLNEILSSPFYLSLVKETDKIIEIKLNLPRIAMAVLQKGHIGEVQAGVISTESKHVKERHKVEII